MSVQTQLGPLISKTQHQRVSSYIDVGVKEGAQVLLGDYNPRIDGFKDGYFINPTIFHNVRSDMTIASGRVSALFYPS